MEADTCDSGFHAIHCNGGNPQHESDVWRCWRRTGGSGISWESDHGVHLQHPHCSLPVSWRNFHQQIRRTHFETTQVRKLKEELIVINCLLWVSAEIICARLIWLELPSPSLWHWFSSPTLQASTLALTSSKRTESALNLSSSEFAFHLHFNKKFIDSSNHSSCNAFPFFVQGFLSHCIWGYVHWRNQPFCPWLWQS